MNCILHNVFSIKNCVTAVVIDGVVLGRRFLSLDCSYKLGCTCTKKEVFYNMCIKKCCDV